MMNKIYEDSKALEYLRYHPKWYEYLENNPSNYNVFINVVKKELKETTYDRLEKVKQQVNFASSIIDYLKK